jgi:hypothetical protein
MAQAQAVLRVAGRPQRWGGRLGRYAVEVQAGGQLVVIACPPSRVPWGELVDDVTLQGEEAGAFIDAWHRSDVEALELCREYLPVAGA